MPKVFVPLLTCGLLLFATAAMAQAPPPADSVSTIRATASEVLLDLVVRDKHGKLVKNLKSGDVEILEDGSRREILSFRFVNGRDPQRASESKRSAAQAAIAAGPTGAPAKPLRAVNLVCIVFHNLDPAMRKWATDATQDFLKNDLLPDTYVGVFSLDDSLTPLQSFTNDRSRLQAAAAAAFTNRGGDATGLSEAVLTANPNMALVTGSVDMVSHTASFNMVVAGGEVSSSAITGAEVSTDAGSNRQRGDSVSQRRQFGGIEGLRQTDQVLTLIKELAKLPGRKTVLFMSPGVATTGDPERLESLIDKASEAGVTFYAVDANGLSENSASLASSNALGHVTSVSRTQTAQSASAGDAAEKSRQGDYQIEAVRTSGTQATLRAIAESTGGFLIANTNDFKKPFTKLIEEMDAHYEAVYRPQSKVEDGSFRKIEVKLAKPDMQVESRTGYFAMPDLKGSSPLAAFETIGLAVLNAQPRPHAFDFNSSVLHFGPGAAGSRNILSFELPAASLTATAEPQLRRHRLHVALVALVKDSSGQVVDKFSQDIPYFVPDQNLTAMLATPIPFKHAIDLPPGSYTLEAVLIDREGRRASTATVPFVSADNKGVALSSVMLVHGLEPVQGAPDSSDPLIYQGKQVVPDLTPTLAADATPLIYFVVYPDKSLAEAPKLQVEFFADAKPIAIQSVKLPPPNASGAVAMLMRGPARSGDCELKISTIQGDGSAEQSLKYKVLAK